MEEIRIFVDLELEYFEVKLAVVSPNGGVTELHLALGSEGGA